MAKVACVRCGGSKEALQGPPVGGRLGLEIQASVCAECWTEWQEMSRRIIAHYGLNLGYPGHRQQLRELMKEFLNLPSAGEAGAGGVPSQ
jgi:Fe-S cluster biosynthesis and repair protein YggX|nr:Fe(2+)-trafficking protein [uncultured bacterium]